MIRATADPLENTCAASLPAGGLGALADLRGSAGIRVIVEGERAWVRWGPGDERVLMRLMAAPGVELFDRVEGVWYRLGRRLPAFGVPLESGESEPLERAIVPTPIRPTPPGAVSLEPVPLGLVRVERPRPATALRCRLAELAGWAESAPSTRLEAVLAAWDGDRAMLLGRTLPPIIGGERFWGEDVLIPLGFRAEPELPASALRGALGVDEGDLLVIEQGGCEVVPREAFRPLTRAGFRLALREAAP